MKAKKEASKTDKKGEEDYTGIDHLMVLRKSAIRVCIFFVIILVAAFNMVPVILDFITLTSTEVTVDLNVFNITDPLLLYFRIASLVAFIFSFPYMIVESWLFIRPGLTKKEKKFINLYMPMIFVLFLLGIAFTYFVLVPYYVVFSQKLAGNTDLTIVMGANKYIDFIGRMLLYFGLIFQFPLLVMILSYLKVLNSKLLKIIRKYAYFALLVISAFLTPPDPVSMGIALLPLMMLYEFSIVLCKVNERSV